MREVVEPKPGSVKYFFLHHEDWIKVKTTHAFQKAQKDINPTRQISVD
jgi:DNA-binding transcriptional regulator GbsR (MarR family)